MLLDVGCGCIVVDLLEFVGFCIGCCYCVGVVMLMFDD